MQNVEQAIAPTSKQLVIVSFIGLLLLLAIIQNTLASAKRKDTMVDVLPSKRKRDVHAIYDFNSVVSITFMRSILIYTISLLSSIN